MAVLADGLDGKIKTGDPLSSFPIRSSVRCNALCSRRARSEECVRAYDLPVPLLLRHRGEGDHGDRAALRAACCVNVRLLSAIKKISPLIYSQSWVGSWVYTTQAMMTFTLIF